MKKIELYWKLIVIGIVIYFFTGWVYDLIVNTSFGRQVIRHYYDNNVRCEYVISDFEFWFGETLAWILVITGISITQSSPYRKSFLRLFIDWELVEIIFLLVSNPYQINRSKWLCIGVTVLVFIVHTFFIRLIKRTVR